MKIHELMSRNVTTLGPHATIQQAARLMESENVGLLPIMGIDNIPLGIVTDRDLAVRAISKRLPPETPVSEAMTHQVFTVTESDDLSAALKLMESKRVGRVLVCDNGGRLVGVLSLIDVISHEGVGANQVGRALRSRTPVAAGRGTAEVL